jgi:hypothetical protein
MNMKYANLIMLLTDMRLPALRCALTRDVKVSRSWQNAIQADNWTSLYN